MSLLGGNGAYQDLLGQNSASIVIEADEIIVNDGLQLLYTDPNSNLVTDNKQNVITEPKDSFVDVANQITWSQNVRQFTASLPQDIAITSDVKFNRVEAKDSILVGDSGGGGGTFNPQFATPTSATVSITTTTNTDDTITVSSSSLTRGAVGNTIFANTDSIDVIFDITALSGNNLWVGIASIDYTPTDALNGISPTTAGDNIFYISSNTNITGNFTGAPINTIITAVSGDKIKLTLTGGNLTFNFDTGGGFVNPYTINTIDTNSYRIFCWDGSTNSSSFSVVVSGSITTGSPPIVEKDFTVNGESLFYENIYLDNLTANKNLIIDGSQIIKTEDRDSFVDTVNIQWTSVARAFTADTVQDITTTSDVVFNTVNTGQGANELYPMDQAVLTSSNVSFNEITITTDQILNYLSAYDVLYLNINKEIRGVRLNDDEILVGTTTDPVAQHKDSFYELHQNQLGSKFDPLKKATNITIEESGLTVIKANDVLTGRVMCINYFEIPRNTVGDFNTRFGFEIKTSSGSNVNVGFGTPTLPLNSASKTDTGNYSVQKTGQYYENGVLQGFIGTTYADGDYMEFVIRTDDKYEIYKNNELVFTSINTILNGQYYPQVFDSNITLGGFTINLYQSYRGNVSSNQVILTDRGTVTAPSISFIDNTLGFYSDSATSFRVICNSLERYHFGSSSFRPIGGALYNLGNASNYWLNSYINTGDFGSGGIQSIGSITCDDGVGLAGAQFFGHPINSQALPAYAFNIAGGNSSGMYLKNGSPREIRFSVGGTHHLRIGGTYVNPNPGASLTSTGILLGEGGRSWRRLYAFLATAITSDRRHKTNIEQLQCGLNDIMTLKPMSYEKAGKKCMGLIAQDVKETKLNCCVEYNEDSDVYSLSYTELIAPMIKAIQELKIALEEANTAINELKIALVGANTVISDLKEENTSIKATLDMLIKI